MGSRFNSLKKSIKRFFIKNKQRPQWSRERQPDPPNFGQAQRITMDELEKIVKSRRPYCDKILSEAQSICSFVPGKVSLVILSCKRLPELKRLLDGLIPFFRNIERYRDIEKILVDNGSGHAIVNYCKNTEFFDRIVAHPRNLGMARALNDIYPKCEGEYILFVEDDFVIDYPSPFINRCIDLFIERPEVGIIRLKNQNNWWKPERIISPKITSQSGISFWIWLPSKDFTTNVWACGSVIFRKVSFISTGLLPVGSDGRQQAIDVESTYGKKYNRLWLAAKIENCYPFVQPNDNAESPGFTDALP
jgi:hypothetical protein